MPYIIRKHKNKWIVVDRETNKPLREEEVIISYDTREAALEASK